MSNMLCKTCIGILQHRRHVFDSAMSQSELDSHSMTEPFVWVSNVVTDS
jgi:hypothetical protein